MIEQFTGLYDKNGTEIYEGDVISKELDTGRRIYAFPVEFHPPCFVFVGYDSGDYYHGEDPMMVKTEELVVVGNIHKNPELLRGVDESK